MECGHNIRRLFDRIPSLNKKNYIFLFFRSYKSNLELLSRRYLDEYICTQQEAI